MAAEDERRLISNAIKAVASRQVDELTRPCLRLYKAVIVDAPSPFTGLCTVRFAGEHDSENTAAYPFMPGVYGAQTGDLVWVASLFGNLSNALVVGYYDLGVFNTPKPQKVILTSPGGKLFNLTVSDTGVLSTSLIRTEEIFSVTVDSSLGDVSFTISGTGITVDFGDGTTASYATASSQSVTHTYGTAGSYSLTIDGATITSISFAQMSCLVSIDSPFTNSFSSITSFQNTFNRTGISSITPSLFENCSNVTNMNSCFAYNNSLITVPEGVFRNLSSVTNYYMVFRACQNMQDCPNDLFSYSPLADTFQSAFYTNYKMKTLPSLDNNPAAKNVNYTFYQCYAATGNATELWDSSKFPNITSHNQCFTGCTNLSNYADIPSGWK